MSTHLIVTGDFTRQIFFLKEFCCAMRNIGDLKAYSCLVQYCIINPDSLFSLKVTTPSLMKPSGISLERIHQLFQRLKLASLSQSLSSTQSGSDLAESFNTESTRVCVDSEAKDYYPTQSCSTLADCDSFRRDSVTEQETSGPSLNEICGAPNQPEFCYEAESPDEAALVHAACAYQFTLVSRTADQVTVKLPEGSFLTFDLLFTLGFDSNRKRMSVVVRHPLTNEIIVYTKGADSVIMDLLEDPGRGNLHTSQATIDNVCIDLHAMHI